MVRTSFRRTIQRIGGLKMAKKQTAGRDNLGDFAP